MGRCDLTSGPLAARRGDVRVCDPVELAGEVLSQPVHVGCADLGVRFGGLDHRVSQLLAGLLELAAGDLRVGASPQVKRPFAHVVGQWAEAVAVRGSQPAPSPVQRSRYPYTQQRCNELSRVLHIYDLR